MIARDLDLSGCHSALTAVPEFRGLSRNALRPLPTKGISHDHVEILDIEVDNQQLLLRIPRFSQWGATPAARLAYEEAAFRRAAGSGHVPCWHHTLPVSRSLPTGGLIVQRIPGRTPRLPQELAAIATALAAIHESALPSPAGRPPLLDQRRPFADTLAVIETQAADLADAGLTGEALDALTEELTWVRAQAAAETRDFPAPALVGTDTHPGNFLIDDTGKAWFVDLEKAVYGAPPIDLAHATLTTSTGWDPDCANCVPTDRDISAFYAQYLNTVGPRRAALLEPFLIPMRRLTWLRTMTWFARWQARWRHDTTAARQESTITRHIAQHIAASFAPETIVDTRRQWLGPDRLIV